ncbi:MAG: rRNA maturation RNase YbeY [Streptococcaceae bacterium]|nr:rRNA maturation RNase YbeY [Streptococcaceae bacterium]
MYIQIMDETGRVSKEIIKQTQELLKQSAQALKLSDNKEMSVTFVDNLRSQEINLHYRQKDAPTDVISLEYQADETEFFFDEDMEIPAELADELADSFMGELFISIDKAKEQAEEYGHSLEREYGWLAVHGFLHINGYDHYTPEEEKEMFDLQKEILETYGLTR